MLPFHSLLDSLSSLGNAEGEKIIGHRIFPKSYDLVNFYLEFAVSSNDPTPRGRKPITRILEVPKLFLVNSVHCLLHTHPTYNKQSQWAGSTFISNVNSLLMCQVKWLTPTVLYRQISIHFHVFASLKVMGSERIVPTKGASNNRWEKLFIIEYLRWL